MQEIHHSLKTKSQNYLEVYQNVKRIRSVWKKSVHSPLSNQVDIVMYDNETLYLESSNPIWAHEIQYYRSIILQKINRIIFGKVQLA